MLQNDLFYFNWVLKFMENAIKTVTIIGCGWFGLPFAKKAIEAGFNVKGTTSRVEKLAVLEQAGIESYVLQLPASSILPEELFKSDLLLINLPPGRRNPDVLKDYPMVITEIIHAATGSGSIKKVIFISSTSVYGDKHQFIDENTPVLPVTDSGKALIRAEQIISESEFDSVILRFGGLAGSGRHPGRFLAGRTGLSSGDQAINFLHLEDAIGVAMLFVTNGIGKYVYNIVAPKHPDKKEFYIKMAKMIGLEPPTFMEDPGTYRREISSGKLIIETGYNFRFPDPMYFEY